MNMPIKAINFLEYHNNFQKNQHVESKLEFGVFPLTIPLVTIAIPTFRRPELLIEAVKSVIGQRNFSDFEIIIVDNDHERRFFEPILQELKKIASQKIRYYVNDENIGSFGNWNRCIELAAGVWMTILGDDDVLFENYLVEMCTIIKSDPSIDRVECRYVSFNNSIQLKDIISDKLSSASLRISEKLRHYHEYGEIIKVEYMDYLYGCFTAPHTQLYKRDLAIELGGFNSKYYPAGDYVFNLQYLYYFPNALFLNKYLCGYRWLCNDSLRKVVQIGILKWNSRIHGFLLSKDFKLCRLFFYKLMNIIAWLSVPRKVAFWRKGLRKIIWVLCLLLLIFEQPPQQD